MQHIVRRTKVKTVNVTFHCRSHSYLCVPSAAFSINAVCNSFDIKGSPEISLAFRAQTIMLTLGGLLASVKVFMRRGTGRRINCDEAGTIMYASTNGTLYRIRTNSNWLRHFWCFIILLTAKVSVIIQLFNIQWCTMMFANPYLCRTCSFHIRYLWPVY